MQKVVRDVVKNVFCELLTYPLTVNQYLMHEEPDRIGNEYFLRTGKRKTVVLADFNRRRVLEQHFKMTELLGYSFWPSVPFALCTK
jgi:hypothetical protein